MCECIDMVNDALRSRNTKLATNLTFGPKGGKIRMVLPVPTRKINSKRREPVIHVAAKFCPFCGVKIDNGDLEASESEIGS